MELAPATEADSAADGVDRRRTALAAARTPTTVTPQGDRPLSGRISARTLGHLRVRSLEGEAQRLGRSAPAEACVALLVLTAGTATLLQDGRHAVAHAGDLLLYDTARPYTLDFPERFAGHIVHLPRPGLQLSDAELRAVTVTTIPATDGIGALLGPFLLRLLDPAQTYGPAVAARLAAGVEDLVGTLVAERSPFCGDGDGRRALVLRVRDHIDRRLTDPDLTPETVAAAHHISVRYLHKLFEAEGVTVARLIQRRRLQESARELARGGGEAPAVAAVAHRWGFVNAAHFSRAFRRLYGHAPREWRQLRTAHEEQPGHDPAAPVAGTGRTTPGAGRTPSRAA
ncbi:MULTISPECIES: helix-turn-helix domain-containing protein [unclassified Streptomyces]|uniref:helix-turn-helix domain-containing protein n=1 Tax=unclassified Streptomyces TaxID=2593676 RepID=UPI0036F726EA